jgi:Raf kinase inhibitor-like YbhB/YbcL family protein
MAAPVAVAVLFATAAAAQNAGGPPPGPGDGPPVDAMTLAPAKGGAKLTVTSTAFTNNGGLDDKYTQFGDNKSPPLAWTKGPAGTMSYVVMTEDMGGRNHDPVIHWVMYDVPASTMSEPMGLATDAKMADGSMQALNSRKNPGYMGPRPPAGQMHPYHYEVFALDKKLGLDPATTDRNAVVAAMKDHVLASGEVVADVTGKAMPAAK